MQHLISVILKSNIVWKIDIPNTAIFDFNIDQKMWMNIDACQYNPVFYKINRFCDDSHIEKQGNFSQEEIL